MKYTPTLARLIDSLRCLPGVGPKSAQRMAFYLLERDRDGGRTLSQALAGALQQVAAGAFAQLARIPDVLLGAGALRAKLVVAALHARRRIAQLAMEIALLLDRRFRRALVRQCLLHVQFARAHGTVLNRSAAVEFARPQRQQFGGQGTLLRLEVLVTARGVGLALQVPDLLVDLVAQILQPRQVLARIGHAHLG